MGAAGGGAARGTEIPRRLQTGLGARLKLQAERLGVRKLNLGPLGGRLAFVEKPSVEPLAVIRLVQRESTRYAFDGPDKLRIRVNLEDPGERLRFAEELLQKLETRHAA